MITGEKIQKLSSFYVGYDSDFYFNPTIASEKGKHRNLYDLERLDIIYNPNLVFCYTHRVNDLIDLLPKFKNRFSLIMHNSDYEITDKIIEKLINNDKIISIYSQNLITSKDYDNVHPLPIGIQNSQWTGGWLNLPDTRLCKKTEIVYFNFFVETNRPVREKCLKEVSKTGLCHSKILPYNIYIENMFKYMFVICPTGNGTDTHRFWEALYLKCIPIVERNNLITKFEKTFPMVILESWEEFEECYNIYINEKTYNRIMSAFDDYQKYLNFDFLKQQILTEKTFN